MLNKRGGRVAVRIHGGSNGPAVRAFSAGHSCQVLTRTRRAAVRRHRPECSVPVLDECTCSDDVRGNTRQEVVLDLVRSGRSHRPTIRAVGASYRFELIVGLARCRSGDLRPLHAVPVVDDAVQRISLGIIAVANGPAVRRGRAGNRKEVAGHGGRRCYRPRRAVPVLSQRFRTLLTGRFLTADCPAVRRGHAGDTPEQGRIGPRRYDTRIDRPGGTVPRVDEGVGLRVSTQRGNDPADRPAAPCVRTRCGHEEIGLRRVCIRAGDDIPARRCGTDNRGQGSKRDQCRKNRAEPQPSQVSTFGDRRHPLRIVNCSTILSGRCNQASSGHPLTRSSAGLDCG